MAANGRRQRKGRASLWISGILLLLVAAGGIGAYLWWKRDRSEVDPEGLARLDRAALDGDPAPGREFDWPQWRGPRRGGLSRETGLLSEWPAGGPPVAWTAKSGAGFSSFAVAAGRAYTMFQDGGREAVVCWDADTGEERWRFAYPASYSNPNGSGPRSTPAVDGGRVYTVGGTGVFHCLDAGTGRKLWRHDLLEEFHAPNLAWGVTFSPLVEGDLVVTNPGGPHGNSVAAFHKRDGRLVWKALDDPAGYSSPVAATFAGVRQLLLFTGNGLVGLAPADGRLLWRYGWMTDYGCNIATPIVAGDYVFISSGYGHGCAMLEVVRDGDGWQARRVYENRRMKNHFSTSVRAGDYLYGFDDAQLCCMEFRTGKVRWKRGGFDKGSLLVADGRLVVLGEHGRLALAEASPDGYRERGSFDFSHALCWSVPAAANGRLYVRDQEKVVCYDVRERGP